MEPKPEDVDGQTKPAAAATAATATTTTTGAELDTEAKPKEPAPTAATDVPDPDEDDLDDLDDMLDEFTPTKTEPKIASGPGRPQSEAKAPELEEGLSDEDFAKQLQDGMADLLGGLETSPEMQAQFENMLKELGGAAALGEAAGLGGGAAESATKSTKDKSAPVSGGGAATAAGSGSATEESFQETIKKTMERMRESGDQATAAAASDNSDDLLAEMMKAMQASGLGEGEGSEEDFSKMLLGMMEQLTNKDILYEPMKELDVKFPDWMAKNEGKVDGADLKRYKEQQVYVKEIVDRFEKKGYSDENAADREYIVERMQKMQAAGSPPPDLVGDMAAAQEAFGAPEEGCPQQ